MKKGLYTLLLASVCALTQATTEYAMQPPEQNHPQQPAQSTFTKATRYALFEIAIPNLLKSNKYTRYSIYPYTWWYKGKREAINLIILDGIVVLAEKATKDVDFLKSSSENPEARIRKTLVDYTAAFLINRYISQPLTSIILDRSNN